MSLTYRYLWLRRFFAAYVVVSLIVIAYLAGRLCG
jgi:hypothetical protein